MALETTLYTLRHAHTGYNGEKRYAGTIDISISEAGVRDATAAAARMAGLHFDAVVASQLRRSYETARILVGPEVPIRRTRLCNERNFGVLEGLTWNEVQTLQPPILLISVGNDLHTVNPPRAEPFEDIWERAKKFRRFLFREYGGRKVLVVSHGVFLQMFHGLLKGFSCIESLGVYPANLELHRFRFVDETLAEVGSDRLGDPAASF